MCATVQTKQYENFSHEATVWFSRAVWRTAPHCAAPASTSWPLTKAFSYLPLFPSFSHDRQTKGNTATELRTLLHFINSRKRSVFRTHPATRENIASFRMSIHSRCPSVGLSGTATLSLFKSFKARFLLSVVPKLKWNSSKICGDGLIRNHNFRPRYENTDACF